MHYKFFRNPRPREEPRMIALQEYPSETLQRILKELNFISWGIDYLITTSQFPLTEEKQALQTVTAQ